MSLPSVPGFEFASAFFEDKKPLHQMLEDAYRQNRMSTASAVRQLHSLHINAPIFGLIWSNGTVRAHVDWCKDEHGDIVGFPVRLVVRQSPELLSRWFYQRLIQGQVSMVSSTSGN